MKYLVDSRGWKEKAVERKCKGCGKTFLARVVDVRKGKGIFHSRKCKGMGWNSKGKNNPKWNGGKTTVSNGFYVAVKQVGHPRADRHGYVREHHLVMEKKLGRYLKKDEEVHHKNGNKRDNRIENLETVSSRNEHLKLEHKMGTYKNHLEKLNGGAYL